SWAIAGVGLRKNRWSEMVLAVDNEKRPLPARLREKVNDDAEKLFEPGGRRAVGWRRDTRERPVHHERATLDHAARHRPPVARVARSIAVVTHRKISIGRHGVGSELIARSIWLRQRRLQRKDIRIDMDDIWLVEHFAVDRELLVANLENIARHPDHALDEIGVGLQRVSEHDDVTATNIAQRDVTLQRIRCRAIN